MVEEQENRIRAETETRKIRRIEEFDSMLNDKTDAYHKYIEEHPEAQKMVDKSKELFLPKTTLENLKSLYKGAEITGFFLNGVSVLTGFSAPYFFMKSSMPDLGDAVTTTLAASVSLGALALVEWGKRETVKNFAVPFFRERKLKPGWVLGSGLFISISVYASVQGAGMFVKQTSTKTAEAGALSKTRADSVARAWDAEIAFAVEAADAAKKQANDFLASNMVTEGGEKVFSANTAVKKAYAKLQADAADARGKVAETRERKLQALSKEEGKAETAGAKAETETAGAANGMMGISGLFEALCLLSLLFQYHFFAAIFKETLGIAGKGKGGKQTETEKKNAGAGGLPVGDPAPISGPEDQEHLTKKPKMTVWTNEPA